MEDLEVSRRFWQGKRVFVTGHTGFKGSWLCRWLLRMGANIAGYSLDPPTAPSLYTALALDRDIASTLPADVRDQHRLHEALLGYAPDVVFHLAAQPLVSASFERPLETYETNVMGTAFLLDAVRACQSARAVVVVTSDKCYEQGDAHRRHSENDPLGGRDPYSASKACAELIVAAYRSSFFSQPPGPRSTSAAVATARAGNVLGGGDWSPHRLVPDAIAAFSSGTMLQLRRPDAVRPWQHVLDPLHGYMRLAQALFEGGSAYAAPWNFGPPASHEVRVEALVRELARAWGSAVQWQASTVAQPFNEAAALRVNSERAERELGWRVRLPLAQAIRTTVDWYRSYLSGTSARTLVDADIAMFETSPV